MSQGPLQDMHWALRWAVGKAEIARATRCDT